MTENPFGSPGRWLKANLHMHTTESDGEWAPQAAVDAYHEQGYDILAITDHNTVTDVAALDDRAMTLLPGVEIGAGAAELGQSVHTVGLGLEACPPNPETENPQDFITALAEVSEVCFVAHPSWSSLTFADIVGLEGIIGVEVYNTTCHRGIGQGNSEVQWDACLARGRDFLGLAVDDAHCHYPDAFGGWAMIKAEQATPESIYQALLAGRFYASSGPTIEGLEVRDHLLQVRCSPCVEILAICPLPGRGWTNWRDGEAREPFTEYELIVRPGTDPVRIVVVDERGNRAWTNAFHLEGPDD
jgi:hypothetical protein